MESRSRRALVFGGVITAGLVAVATVAALPTAQAATPSSPQAAPALAASAASSLVASRPAYLHASADDSFVQHNVITGQGGLQAVPYDRTYRGLPVIGGDFVITTDSSGNVLYQSVAQTQTINLASLTPTVTAAQAQASARTALKTVDAEGASSLAVLATDTPRLVWTTRVTGATATEPSSQDVYVDAQTGQVVGTKEHVAFDGNAAINGPNPVPLDTTQSGGQFLLQDPTIRGLACQNLSTRTTFSHPTNHFGNGNPTSIETGCVDAMFVAQSENKMLSQWDGRNSFDGNGGAWPLRVGLADLNAFYDGTEVQIGHNQQNDWISSLDVVGHEMGHGVDDHTPGGISGNGTQEFVADTFGAASEWFANEPAPFDTPDFTVGEEINLVGSGPIRIMFNPSQIGDPNCFTAGTPNLEVHKAAGPGDHAFYLIAEGTNPTNGQPTSPTCNNTQVTGIGIQKAEQVMYNAMLMKTSAASYPNYRLWTLRAAKALDATCTEFNTVKAAWNAVSVPAQAGEPTCTSGPPPTTTTTRTTPPTSSSSSSSTPPTTSTTNNPGGCNGISEWNATTAYVPNDVVSHNGDKWTALWFSTGAEPGSPIAWNIWQDNGAC